jgi:hypothetical protein
MGDRDGWLDPKPDQLPTIKVTKVSFHNNSSVEERREQIRVRQEHVQRRYRQY